MCVCTCVRLLISPVYVLPFDSFPFFLFCSFICSDSERQLGRLRVRPARPRLGRTAEGAAAAEAVCVDRSGGKQTNKKNKKRRTRNKLLMRSNEEEKRDEHSKSEPKTSDLKIIDRKNNNQ